MQWVQEVEWKECRSCGGDYVEECMCRDGYEDRDDLEIATTGLGDVLEDDYSEESDAY